jgi:lysophospholipase L1-like esterase
MPTTSGRWVGAWACAPQLTESGDLPPAPGLANNTLRQVVFPTVGGRQFRLRLSNAHGDGPVTMRSVHVARAAGGSRVEPASDTALTFWGIASVTIAAGDVVFSDPFELALGALTRLAVTIQFGAVPSQITGHPGSRTTSYLTSGAAVSAATLLDAATTEHWYYLTGVDVMADAATAAVVTLGDSITDGRGSTTDGNDRWPDALARRLQGNAATTKVSVLNQGIGGNAVLSGGLGPTAVQRFAGDVLDQSGVRWLILLEGVNDIGCASGRSVASDLIATFGAFVDLAHARNIRVYGVPILPFGGSQYANAENENARQVVNTWVRTGGKFDAVIDLDAAVRDPMAPHTLLPAYDSGDHLHLGPAGYQRMADAIDLALFR